MAFVHGKSSYVSIATHNISPYTNKTDFPRNVDTAETSAFGSSDKTYIPGLKGATFSVEGLWDTTLDEWMDAALGTEVAVVYIPQGNSPGNVRYAFQAILTSYNPPGSISDAVKYSAAFMISGAVTRNVVT
jgi:hypothetical protein